MGFNLSGVAINRNFKNDIPELSAQLGLAFELDREITFQEASANWKDQGICDVYFGENGTLLFMSMDRCVDEMWYVEDAYTLTFALSEMSMSFSFNYYKVDEMIRSFVEVEGNRISDQGKKLPVEESESDTAEIIWKQLGEVLGQTFWSIGHDEKAFRYKIK